MLDGDAVFVPDDIPRRGVFALWGTGSGTGKVEFVFARGADGLRKRVVTASFLSVAEALPELLSIEPNATGPAGSAVRPTLGVWAAAATAGVGLVARGRLLPTVGPGGMDAWRIGPLEMRRTSPGCASSLPASRRPRTPWRSLARGRCGSALPKR